MPCAACCPVHADIAAATTSAAAAAARRCTLKSVTSGNASRFISHVRPPTPTDLAKVSTDNIYPSCSASDIYTVHEITTCPFLVHSERNGSDNRIKASDSDNRSANIVNYYHYHHSHVGDWQSFWPTLIIQFVQLAHVGSGFVDRTVADIVPDGRSHAWWCLVQPVSCSDRPKWQHPWLTDIWQWWLVGNG